MTAIELYKFINTNGIEWHYRDNDGTEDVLIFPYITQIEEFNKLLGSYMFDDGGIECTMMDGYFAFWMKDICEYNDIELSDIFNKEDDK